MAASTDVLIRGAEPQRSTNRWLVLVIVCMADFMVILDSTIVNVALPSIQRDLDFSLTDLQWVVNIYTLFFGGFLLLGGRSGDLFGRQRLFVTGLALFTLSSLLNGAASSNWMLVAGRALQGLGAALVAPTTLSILITTFVDPEERGRAVSIWSAIAGGGAAVGLLLGGLLTDQLSWRWVFYVNIPVGLTAIALGLRFVPNSRETKHSGSLDILGALTVTGGLLVLIYDIVKAQEWGWGSARVLGLGVVAFALFAAFVAIELRSKAPLIRLSVFRNRSLTSAVIVMLLFVSGLFGMFYFTSLYFQQIHDYSPMRAGFAFLPMPFAIVTGATLSQRLTPKLGVRTVVVTGLTLATAGLLMLTQLPVDGNYLRDVLPGFVIMAVGAGLVFPTVILIATTTVTGEDAGLGSGLINTAQQVGGALGLAILATFAANRTNDLGVAGQPPTPEALVSGFHLAFLLAALFTLSAMATLLLLLRARHVAMVRVVNPAMAEAAAAEAESAA